MNVRSEASRSLWMETARVRDAHAIDSSHRVEVIVIGAGIAGLSVAYEVARAGKSVVVVDRGALGGGMTARTTAHLSSAIDDGFDSYRRLRGRDEARAYFDSQSAAISRIEAIIRDEGIDCDFSRVDGYLVLAEGQGRDVLERELAACHDIGFLDVAYASPPMWAGEERPALRFPHQGRFHPLKYLDGLIGAIEARGGKLFAHSPVVDVAEQGGEVVVSTSAGHTLRARAAVVATNSPINDRFALHTKQAPYRTYAFAAPIDDASGVVDALYWDTEDPYHYVRFQPRAEGGWWLISGGEDHKSGGPTEWETRFQRLEAWTRARFPGMGEPAHRWSGQVMEPVDAAPFIGLNPGNKAVYVSTADSGEGITTGVVAGMLLGDLVLGKPNGWARTYAPNRKTLRAVGQYISENATVAANITEHVRGGDVGAFDAIAPGQGAVVRQGLKKVAAYRDPAGALHLRSAVCTHASCIVHWNDFETCWDCPCHGSQFSVDGRVLNGPATMPLPAHKV
ncbi:MAG TPA: FAD-dependent oxidoreductase [Beijerinckiaceae bacterium]|jgi:glycine/D-amino acid oxidase-like deaminating enzyme/nitrite reductase/ring-hydroxylating ferredoxin subunit